MNKKVRQFSNSVTGIFAAGLLALVLSIGVSQRANSSTTWEFNSGGSSHTQTNGGSKNTREWTQDGYAVTGTAWADTGWDHSGETRKKKLLRSHLLRDFRGIGICNGRELYEGCVNRWLGADHNQADNHLETDFFMLYIDELEGEDWRLDSLVIDPRNWSDRDATYWIGDFSEMPSLQGATYADLEAMGFSPFVNVANTKGNSALAIDLGGVNGNTILIGATRFGGDDRWLMTSMTASVVPLPAAIWMFLSALGLLAWFRRRSSIDVEHELPGKNTAATARSPEWNKA